MFPEFQQQIQRLRVGSFNPFATTFINDWQALWVLMLISSVGIIVSLFFLSFSLLRSPRPYTDPIYLQVDRVRARLLWTHRDD